jgi:hypothetical protein
MLGLDIKKKFWNKKKKKNFFLKKILKKKTRPKPVKPYIPNIPPFSTLFSLPLVMDKNQTLISAGISIATYILYKIAQRYYIRSGCHNSTIEIVIVNKEAEKEEKEQELKEKEKEKEQEQELKEKEAVV